MASRNVFQYIAQQPSVRGRLANTLTDSDVLSFNATARGMVSGGRTYSARSDRRRGLCTRHPNAFRTKKSLIECIIEWLFMGGRSTAQVSYGVITISQAKRQLAIMTMDQLRLCLLEISHHDEWLRVTGRIDHQNIYHRGPPEDDEDDEL